jgi:hypothetical protein
MDSIAALHCTALHCREGKKLLVLALKQNIKGADLEGTKLVQCSTETIVQSTYYKEQRTENREQRRARGDTALHCTGDC